MAFIPRFGLQDDETLFAEAIFEPRTELYNLQIGHTRLPFMLANYLGTLKAWIYRFLFHWSSVGPRATRVPMLLAGVASIWLFYLLLFRLAGRRVAWIGCSLLATDAIYLLCSSFDWGPVALQHLLILGGLLLLVRFWQERRDRLITAGFLLWGLAMWDKAIAIWILGGIGVAALVILPRQIREVWSMRRLGMAAAGLVLGALPLIVYNVDSGLGTFHGTAVFDASQLPKKVHILRVTFDGSGLLEWLTAADALTPQPHQPRGWLEAASANLASWTGGPRSGLLLFAFGAALLLAPLTQGPDLRLILFALIALAVAWAQMLFTANAGTGMHHTILLWPLPQTIIAVSFAAASRRLGRWGVPVLSAVMVVVLGSNVAVMNQYFAQTVRNGGALNWTNAINDLSAYFKHAPAPHVVCVDWGICDQLRLLQRGRLPLVFLNLSGPELTPEAKHQLAATFAVPGNVFTAHTPGMEFVTGAEARLEKFAEGSGYRREILAMLSDSYGRPTFELYRFVPMPGKPD